MVPPPRGSCTQQGGTRAQEESWAAGSLGTEPAGEASAAPASPCTPGEGHQQPREGDGDRADPSRPSPCPPLSLHEPPRVQLPCSQSPKTQKTHTLVHTHTACSQTLTLTHTHTHTCFHPHTHTLSDTPPLTLAHLPTPGHTPVHTLTLIPSPHLSRTHMQTPILVQEAACSVSLRGGLLADPSAGCPLGSLRSPHADKVGGAPARSAEPGSPGRSLRELQTEGSYPSPG